ncbi:MAG: hypothetical protein ABTQ27_05295 [Amaricoccus sp.]|uniref:hypothetical protein n=1 Tax=Amaricoccus sp. TaxID=1872485 RepID=UPI003315D8A0
MLDHLPEDLLPILSDPRLLAISVIATSGARLVRAATRIGGEAGAGLANALRDMVIDPTVDPEHWPIDDMLALLRLPGARLDIQIGHLIAQLLRLRHAIDARPD